MIPVYQTTPKYTVKYSYKEISTEEIMNETEIVYSYERLLTRIQEMMQINKERLDRGYKYELYDINIDHEEEVIDNTIITEWREARPGDFAIHVHSPNNVSSNTEISLDFYVAKLSRYDKEVYVDKYNICWHAMQGVFLIARYPELECIDKKRLIEVLNIYDERTFSTINDQYKEIATKWIYSKIAKYAGLYALENPLKLSLSDIEV